jgi:hypothetical protein
MNTRYGGTAETVALVNPAGCGSCWEAHRDIRQIDGQARVA